MAYTVHKETQQKLKWLGRMQHKLSQTYVRPTNQELHKCQNERKTSYTDGKKW